MVRYEILVVLSGLLRWVLDFGGGARRSMGG